MPGLGGKSREARPVTPQTGLLIACLILLKAGNGPPGIVVIGIGPGGSNRTMGAVIAPIEAASSNRFAVAALSRVTGGLLRALR
jgi:hypothetical protein